MCSASGDTSSVSTGPIGAGIYAFFNRLLIPVGLHHALNSVFWFDVANIADIARFWGTNPDLPGTLGVTGQYLVGFFPVMMFGLPAAALAMYHTAKPQKKKLAYGLLISAALFAFLFWLQKTRAGFWIIGLLLSAFWAFVFGFLAYAFSGEDMVWFYVVMGLGFVLMVWLHLWARDK